VNDIVNTPERGLMMSKYMTDALNRLRQSDIISIAAINGKAIGGGAELTTTTDFRIMSESIDNYISFIHAKLGAAPGIVHHHNIIIIIILVIIIIIIIIFND
jgi:ethylmalonyl-CoA/methylmalonyl-CoA decarboxylase